MAGNFQVNLGGQQEEDELAPHKTCIGGVCSLVLYAVYLSYVVPKATSDDEAVTTCGGTWPDNTFYTYCMMVGGMGVAIGGLNVLVGIFSIVVEAAKPLIQMVNGIAFICTCVMGGWGIYFYFQNHDRVNDCDRTVRIFTEVLFYFAFVGMCLFACLICCLFPVMMGLMAASQGDR